MSILHYTIGLPPKRKGGSVQYAYDLIKEQSKSENIYVLTCGDTLFRGKKAKIKRIGKLKNVDIYELTNPLTPTLIYGISDPVSQHRDILIDFDNISNFIKSNEIEILHLHTLMGLHKKIVEFIKGLGVKIIYTSHDFHGICPHYNLIDYKRQLCNIVNPTKCSLCNINEPSDTFLRIVNSDLYQILKNTKLFRLIKKPCLTSNDSKMPDNTLVAHKKVEEYKNLIDYYIEYFKLIDKFHFNSSQTAEIFSRFLPDISGKTIPVITRGITDKRKPLSLSKEIIFGFIGSLNDYKGFPVLKNVLKDLYEEGINNFKLMVYSGNHTGNDTECPNIIYQPPYDYTQISDIMYQLDCLIIPSKWYETFSLVAIEALAHGRPVIVSDHVGAKDIIRQYTPNSIFESSAQLKELLRERLKNPEILEKNNREICSRPWNLTIKKHAKEIISLYHES